MIIEIKEETCLRDLFRYIDKLNKTGYRCFLKGCGNGEVKLIVEGRSKDV